MKTKKGSVRTILTYYRQFQRKPKKLFLARDFIGDIDIIRERLLVLEKLNLIERVPAVYRAGRYYTILRSVKGYKLKRGSDGK